MRSCFDERLPAWLRKHPILPAFIVILFSLVIRVSIALHVDPAVLLTENPDSQSYLSPAQSLLKQGSFLNKYNFAETDRTPGYPGFLAVVMFLFGDNIRNVLVAQAVILSFQVLFLYALMSRIFDPVTALLAGILAAFSPWGASLAVLPLADGLFLLLLTLIALVIKLTTEAQSRVLVCFGAVIVGLLTAGAVLVRPIWPLVFLIGGLAAFLYGFKRSGVWLLLIVLTISAALPILLWRARNQAHGFNGLSETAGRCAWQMLSQRVVAHVNNESRWNLLERAVSDERTWKVSRQERDHERWRRAEIVFLQHPFLSFYYFSVNALEHTVHPSPGILVSPTFTGLAFWILFFVWISILLAACIGLIHLCSTSRSDKDVAVRDWSVGLLAISLLLTLSSGLCIGGGARYRITLELIVPVLAVVGVSRLLRRS